MVIAARDVARWVQPAPRVVQGEANISLAGNGVAVAAGFAPASVNLVPQFPVAALSAAVAGVAVEGAVFVLPAVAGIAVLDGVDATGIYDPHVGVTDALAEVFLVEDDSVAVDVAGQSFCVPFSNCFSVVEVSGSAEMEFDDFGQGSTPVFPFSLPIQFTNRWSNEQDAFAVVPISGVGHSIAVGGFADASLAFDGAGDASVKGSVSVFPFLLPAVFDTSFSGLIGRATVNATSSGSVVVDVSGDAVADIAGSGPSLSAAVFPFAFPTVFYQPFQTGAAGVEVVAVGEVAVWALGQSVVSVAAPGITLS